MSDLMLIWLAVTAVYIAGIGCGGLFLWYVHRRLTRYR